MSEIIDSLMYVINGYMFWPSMGMTSAIAIFVGAIIYHSSPKSTFYKGVLGILTYALFLMFTSFMRVLPNVSHGIYNQKSYASVITTLLITIAYIIGLFIGYFITKRSKNESVGLRK